MQKYHSIATTELIELLMSEDIATLRRVLRPLNIIAENEDMQNNDVRLQIQTTLEDAQQPQFLKATFINATGAERISIMVMWNDKDKQLYAAILAIDATKAGVFPVKRNELVLMMNYLEQGTSLVPYSTHGIDDALGCVVSCTTTSRCIRRWVKRHTSF